MSFTVNLTDEKCKECKTVITDEHRQNYEDVMDMTRQALQQMENVRCELWYLHAILRFDDDFILDLDICRSVDKRQRKVLHERNIWRLKTLDLAFDSAIDFESWSEAVEFGKRFVTGLK